MPVIYFVTNNCIDAWNVGQPAKLTVMFGIYPAKCRGTQGQPGIPVACGEQALCM